MSLVLIASAVPQTASYYDSQGRSEFWRQIFHLVARNKGESDMVVYTGPSWMPDIYSPELTEKAAEIGSLDDVAKSYEAGHPVWIVNPIYPRFQPNADALYKWLGDKEKLVFRFGGWQDVFYFQKGKDTAALWSEACTFDLPDDANLWLTLAETLDARGAQGAVQAYQKVVKVAEDSSLRGLGWERLGDIEFRQGNYRSALDMYQHRLAEAPADGQLLVKLGISYSALKEYAAAEQALTSAMTDHQVDDYWVHRAMGGALVGLGRPGEGLVHYKRALALGPENDDLRYLIGEASLMMGDQKQARKWFEEYLTRSGRCMG